MHAKAIGAVVIAVVTGGNGAVVSPLRAPATEFVGTMPCSEDIRAFIGGVAAGAPCHAVTVRLDLGGAADPRGWTLSAKYGVPAPSNPGASVPGPEVSINGSLERSGTTYRLTSSTGRSIAFREVSSTLIHLLDDRNHLMLGTSGWSYTLSRADAVDARGQPERMPAGSYAPLPRATGADVFAIFGGRTPCTGIVRALRVTLNDGCQRVKWRITLFRNEATGEPSKYRIEGSLHHTGREGTWRIVRGMPSDSSAVIYQLDASGSEAAMLLWKADDDVLFVLDDRKLPLVGTMELSYTLNRSR